MRRHDKAHLLPSESLEKRALISHPFPSPPGAAAHALNIFPPSLPHPCRCLILLHFQLKMQNVISFFIRCNNPIGRFPSCFILAFICNLPAVAPLAVFASRLAAMAFMRAAWEVYILSNCHRGLQFICSLVYPWPLP